MKSIVMSLLLVTCTSWAKTLKVAVIDTGFNKELLKTSPKLCESGHIDFTSIADPFVDNHGHGTHVAGTIQTEAKDSDYCLIIIKNYDPKHTHKFYVTNLFNTVKAFRHAIDQNVDIINYSGGGIQPDDKEFKTVLEALNRGIKVIVAAGNESYDLSKKAYYPACYDSRIMMIGSVNNKLKILKSSNYLPTDFSYDYKCKNNTIQYELGENVAVTLKHGTLMKMTGTSQATAIATGKYIRRLKFLEEMTIEYLKNIK